jgi:UDP-N-acetylglucosamine diphosphorylase / glucose-1-phosphate thymidylyltransferase / UDP-N-acetylgalactosamine diphosphorylase / glucosamine-1-phosphate N-acetyltransferase / galactosamine-1-phosphate N-acetyltransferase
MKALILAGGRGRRLEGHTADRPKCLLPFAGQPLIQYSLDNCVRTHPDEIVLVVGYLADQIVNEYGTDYRGVRVRYAIQYEQRGLVHAIETAIPCLGDADFMLFLADEILRDPDHVGMLERYRAGEVFGLCGVTQPENPEQVRATYAVLEDQDGRILRLVEKPRRAVNRMQGTGNILFNHALLGYIASTPIHPLRNERELPDLIQCAIDDGHIVKSYPIGGRYINMNTPDDIAHAERELLALTANAS